MVSERCKSHSPEPNAPRLPTQVVTIGARQIPWRFASPPDPASRSPSPRPQQAGVGAGCGGFLTSKSGGAHNYRTFAPAVQGQAPGALGLRGPQRAGAAGKERGAFKAGGEEPPPGGVSASAAAAAALRSPSRPPPSLALRARGCAAPSASRDFPPDLGRRLLPEGHPSPSPPTSPQRQVRTPPGWARTPSASRRTCSLEDRRTGVGEGRFPPGEEESEERRGGARCARGTRPIGSPRAAASRSPQPVPVRQATGSVGRRRSGSPR